MATSRNLDLYLNLARPADSVLLAGRSDLTVAPPPVFMDGEKPNLRIQFLQPSLTHGVAPVVTQLEDGDAVVFSLKTKASPALLVSGTGFLLNGSANERRYEALVDFNTTPLVNAFGDETVIPVVGEVRVQNAANTERKTFQFRCTVRKRIYDGEGDPAPATPVYPAPESVLTNGADTAAVKRGTIDLEAGDFAGVEVDFSTAFAGSPVTVRAWVVKKAGAPSVGCDVNHDTITAQGFTVDLAAEIPAGTVGDYKLSWEAIR